MRVARQDADAADGKTGREVRTSHATVAQRLRVTADAVRHARYVLEALGLSVTIVTGRYLTAKERAAVGSLPPGHSHSPELQRPSSPATYHVVVQMHLHLQTVQGYQDTRATLHDDETARRTHRSGWVGKNWRRKWSKSYPS
jgi:hypothetical protein